MTRRVVVASVVTLAVAGCGTSSPSSVVRLRTGATRACTQARERSARIAPPAVPAQTAEFLRRGIAVLKAELAALRTLRAPSQQAGAYSAALGSLAREQTILTTTAHGLDRGADPLTTIRILQHRLAPVEADNAAAWRTLRVPACVNR